MEQQNGLLVVNKPRGLSSAQCTNRFKRLGQKKIGHAGTLDPMAQGVLLVLLGHATKISGYLMAGGEKTYCGTVKFGQTTDTWDAEGTIVSEAPWENVTANAIETLVAEWVGRSEQPVPPYSAAKHQGQPLYKLSRAGKEVPLKIKTIDISRAEVLRVELPYATFRVVCSSGTYIRSLAHSLGMRLGCGAVLTELIREYSHPFGLDRACSLDTILAEPERLPERVLPVTLALPHWPVITVTPEEEADTKNGKPLIWSEERRHLYSQTPQASLRPEAHCVSDGKAVLLSPDGNPLALVEADAPDGALPTWKVLRGLWHD
ncbi:MAG: tRNA pseudouridine(55) synthase TruB [Bilophila sp.]